MPGAIIPITNVYSAVDQLHQSQLASESDLAVVVCVASVKV